MSMELYVLGAFLVGVIAGSLTNSWRIRKLRAALSLANTVLEHQAKDLERIRARRRT